MRTVSRTGSTDAGITRRRVLGSAGASTFAVSTGLGLTQVKPAAADEDLLQLCRRFVQLETEYRRLSAEADALPGRETQASKAAQAALDSLQDDYDQVLSDIAWERATTPAGVRAKAEAVAAYIGRDVGWEGGPRDRILASILRDLTGGVA